MALRIALAAMADVRATGDRLVCRTWSFVMAWKVRPGRGSVIGGIPDSGLALW